MLGVIKQTDEHKRKISESNSGEKNGRWIEDRTTLAIRNNRGDTTESIIWARKVKVRDNWKCRIADENCNGIMEAHHILAYRSYPELRYKVNNGITLCHAHHPRKVSEEKRLVPKFMELVSVSKVNQFAH